MRKTLLTRADSPDAKTQIARLLSFLEATHGPLTGDTPHKDVPLLIHELIDRAGKTLDEVVSVQNTFLSPARMVSSDGFLKIAIENQGVYSWAVSLQGDSNPKIYGRFEGEEPWTDLGQYASDFLTEFVLLETMFAARFVAQAASVEAKQFREIESALSPSPSQPWRWPATGARLYSKGEAIVFACPNGRRHDLQEPDDPYSLWVGAETASELEFLRPLASAGWESLPLE